MVLPLLVQQDVEALENRVPASGVAGRAGGRADLGEPGIREILERLTHSLLVVTSSLTEIKSEYPYRAANPNRITQSLIAVLTGLRLPFICTDSHELGEEIVASYLYQTFLYDWLDQNGHGRHLSDGDL